MTIKIENLSFKYKSFAAESNSVLKHINLKIEDGEFLGLIGPSGSGKTTLIQHITGLLRPDSGRILVNGSDVWGKDISQTHVRRKIGIVFQFPESQLFSETVYEEVAFGPRNLRVPEEDIHHRVQQAMEQVYLEFEEFKDRAPIQLSEGEKRRIAIASVLAMKPEVLILDEPTAGLDSHGVQAVLNIVKNYHMKGRTILFITHNIDLVASITERIVLICNGEIKFDGHKRDLFQNKVLLESMGFSIPRIQKLVQALKQMGWINSNEIYSVSELRHEISRKFNPENFDK